jgi:hypothetical protein
MKLSARLIVGLRLFAMLVMAFGVFSVDMVALAQSSCSRLDRTLSTLERNRDFRSLQANDRAARQVAEQVQQAESQYVRAGCQNDPNQRACRTLARQITSARGDYQDYARAVESGRAVAQQREAVLQDVARFGCNSNSGVTFEQQQSQPQRRSFLDQLFGGFSDVFGGEGQIREDENYGWQDNYATVRSVCVRSCDGYYFPVSYATLPEYLGNDAQQCQQMCPGAQVELYYYSNPGQEAEQMVSMAGVPYSSMPNAFKYRQEFDKTCTCKAPVSQGIMQVNGVGGTIIALNGASFPLPKRDPRYQMPMVEIQQAAIVTVATVDIPLPRRRPPRAGETPLVPPPEVPVGVPATAAESRVVRLGDKMVRVVGPDTPYAQLGGAGS